MTSSSKQSKKDNYVTWEKEIDKSGNYQRQERTFRDFISKNHPKFQPEKNRYHLYVSYACPWAHRTLILLKLKGLEDVISVNVVDHLLESQKSWSLEGKTEGATGDTVNNAKFLKEIYFKADPDYSKSFTVPVLWDKKLGTIVNNESSEIIRMLNSEFNEFAQHPKVDLYPEDLRSQIDELNNWIYPTINNGVYRCGFARTQSAYEENAKNLFESLDKVEKILSTNRYLCGTRFTEADVRLFTTLIRFDLVYYVHFKCNLQHLYEYPNIWGYVKEIYQMPGIADTVNEYHIKHHYYESHKHINPFGIVPIGPKLDFNSPHLREKLEEAHPVLKKKKIV